MAYAATTTASLSDDSKKVIIKSQGWREMMIKKTFPNFILIAQPGRFSNTENVLYRKYIRILVIGSMFVIKMYLKCMLYCIVTKYRQKRQWKCSIFMVFVSDLKIQRRWRELEFTAVLILNEDMERI